AYVLKYTPAGEIVNVTLSLVIGFIREAALPLQQEFQMTFVQDEATVHYAGNPGYVIGLPLVSGTMTADGIVRSINPRDTISVLYSGDNQDCLGGPRLHSPILFGVDFVDATSDWLPVKSNLDNNPNHQQWLGPGTWRQQHPAHQRLRGFCSCQR
ncbi:unnamed protein product, partial [Tetraodon nigroviridis]